MSMLQATWTALRLTLLIRIYPILRHFTGLGRKNRRGRRKNAINISPDSIGKNTIWGEII